MGGKSRATKFRKKKQAEGYKSIAVTITPEAATALTAMKNEFGWTQREAVSNALTFAASEIKLLTDFVEGKNRLEQRNATDRAKDIQDIVGMKRLLAEFEARIASLESSTTSGAAGVEVQNIEESAATESVVKESIVDGRAVDDTQNNNTDEVKTHNEEKISTTPSGKTVRITPSSNSVDSDENSENVNNTEVKSQTEEKIRSVETKPYIDRTVIRPPVQSRIPGVFTPQEKNELLNFAAHCFVQYGQTISRSRTYRMAEEAGLHIHATEEDFGKFLQDNIGEIRRRYMAMKNGTL